MQPVYRPNPDDLTRKLQQEFPAAADRVRAAQLLAGLTDRVGLAVLKLASGAIDDVAAIVEKAKQDDRDVIAAAEYPNYLALGPHPNRSSPECRAAIAADAAQYDRWINDPIDRA